MKDTPDSSATGTISIALRPVADSGVAQLSVDVELPLAEVNGSMTSLAGAVRALVQQLGGSLVVADDADRATLLKATLPVTRLLPAPEPVSVNAVQPFGDLYVEHQRHTPTMRILSVEDQKPNRLMLQAILERAGHRATLSADPDRALSYLLDDRFDLIILDVHMPGLSGFDLAQKLRDLPDDRRHTPIIFLTADISPKTMQLAADVSALHVLSKPIRAERLLAAIASARTATASSSALESA